MAEAAETKTGKRARWLFLAIALIGLPAGGWAVWTYLIYSPQDDNLVVLRADPTPFRVKTAEGTQANVPNQDSTFMGLIDGNDQDNNTSEVIALSDPAPEPPPVPISAPEAQSPADTGSDLSEEPARQNSTTTRSHLWLRQTAGHGPRANASTTNTGTNESDNQTTEVAPAEQAGEQPTDLTRTLTLPDAPKPRPAGARDRRDWMMVQLAAFREEDKARTAAALLNEKHKARLSGYTLGSVLYPQQMASCSGG